MDMDVFDSWLYDAGRPFDYLRFDVYAQMKEDVKTGYFEELIRKYLLNNTHGTDTDRGTKAWPDSRRRTRFWQRSCRAYKASLSGEEVLSTRREDENSSKAFQEAPSDTGGAASQIPMLKREDIRGRRQQASEQCRV